MVDKTAIQYDLIFNTTAAQNDVSSLVVQLRTAQDALAKVSGGAAKVATETKRSFGSVGSSVQNASYQFADLATQIQGGISPVRALSQQLPQLLAGFGAIGAAIGAGVAIFGPYLASLIDLDKLLKSTSTTVKEATEAFDKSATSTKAAQSSVSDLAEKYGTLAGEVFRANQQIAELDRAAALKALREAATAITTQFSNLVYEAQQAGGAFGEIASGLGNTATLDTISGLQEKLGLSREEAVKLNQALYNMRTGTNMEEAAALTEIATRLAAGDEEAQALGRTLLDLVEKMAALSGAMASLPTGRIASISQQFADVGESIDGLVERSNAAKQSLKELTIADNLKTSGASAGEIARQVAVEQELAKLRDKQIAVTPELMSMINQLAEVKAREADINANAAEREKSAAKARADAAKSAAAARNEFKQFTDEIERGVTPLQKAQAELAKLQEEYVKFGDKLSPEQLEAYGRAVEALNEKIEKLTFKDKWEKMAEGIQSVKTPLSELYDSLKQIGDAIEENLASGLTDAIMSMVEGTKSAKDAFKAFAVSFLQEITKMIIKATILYAIQSALGMVGGGGGGIGGFLTGLVGGGVGRSGASVSVGRSATNISEMSNATRVIPASNSVQAASPGGAGATALNVQVINNSSASVSTGRDNTGNIRIMINDEVANALARGGNKIDRALQAGYGLRRSGR